MTIAIDRLRSARSRSRRHVSPLFAFSYPALSVGRFCRGFDRMFPKPRADSCAQHGRFRAPAARQADRLSRVRRALAVPPGHQPDGPQCHRPGARHAGRQARRAQALRRRPRLPLLLGPGEAGADVGPAGRRRARCTTSASPCRRWPISPSSSSTWRAWPWSRPATTTTAGPASRWASPVRSRSAPRR